MTTVSRWLVPALFAAGMGFGAVVPAQAQDDDALARVLVDVADVALRDGQSYYRHGNDGRYDPLIVRRDRDGRPVYYRVVPRGDDRRHDNDGFYYDDRTLATARRVKCNRNGNCTVTYYDPRYDRRRYQSRDGDRRWRDRDDD